MLFLLNRDQALYQHDEIDLHARRDPSTQGLSAFTAAWKSCRNFGNCQCVSGLHLQYCAKSADCRQRNQTLVKKDVCFFDPLNRYWQGLEYNNQSGRGRGNRQQQQSGQSRQGGRGKNQDKKQSNEGDKKPLATTPKSEFEYAETPRQRGGPAWLDDDQGDNQEPESSFQTTTLGTADGMDDIQRFKAKMKEQERLMKGGPEKQESFKSPNMFALLDQEDPSAVDNLFKGTEMMIQSDEILGTSSAPAKGSKFSKFFNSSQQQQQQVPNMPPAGHYPPGIAFPPHMNDPRLVQMNMHQRPPSQPTGEVSADYNKILSMLAQSVIQERPPSGPAPAHANIYPPQQRPYAMHPQQYPLDHPPGIQQPRMSVNPNFNQRPPPPAQHMYPPHAMRAMPHNIPGVRPVPQSVDDPTSQLSAMLKNSIKAKKNHQENASPPTHVPVPSKSYNAIGCRWLE